MAIVRENFLFFSDDSYTFNLEENVVINASKILFNTNAFKNVVDLKCWKRDASGLSNACCGVKKRFLRLCLFAIYII